MLASVRGARVGAGLHRVLLGGQAEGVEPQGVQHVTAVHPEVAGVDVGGDVAERVPDVQSLTRRIREHVLDEQLVLRVPARRPPEPATHRVGHIERPELAQFSCHALSIRPASSAV